MATKDSESGPLLRLEVGARRRGTHRSLQGACICEGKRTVGQERQRKEEVAVTCVRRIHFFCFILSHIPNVGSLLFSFSALDCITCAYSCCSYCMCMYIVLSVYLKKILAHLKIDIPLSHSCATLISPAFLYAKKYRY